MPDKVNLRDSFKFYKDSVTNPIDDVKVYTKLVLGFMKFIMAKVMAGYDIRLGAKLGMIGIRGKKVKAYYNKRGELRGLPPSWAKTKKHWEATAVEMGISFEEYIAIVPKEERQLAYCFNEHSGGYGYRLIWMNQDILVTNKAYYSLTFHRVNRRAVYAAAHDGMSYLPKVERLIKKY